MKSLLYLALIMLTGSCHRQIYEHHTASGWETIEFHDEDHFIWHIKNKEGKFSYKGSYHIQNDTILIIDFLPIHRGRSQLWIDEGVAEIKKIAARENDYLIHLSSYMYLWETPTLHDPINYDRLRVYAGSEMLWEGDNSWNGKCTFSTNRRPDRLVYFHQYALTNVIRFELDEPGEYQLHTHFPYLIVNRGADGCGLADRGPYYGLAIHYEGEQITELHTQSSQPKVYRLRRKSD